MPIDKKRYTLPDDTELFKDHKSGRTLVKQRKDKRKFGDQYFLIALFPTHGAENLAKRAWNMAKKSARDYLRSTVAESVVISYEDGTKGYDPERVRVYEKYEARGIKP